MKLAVYNLRTYFSKQPGDIRCCPACGSALSLSTIQPSKGVAEQISDVGLIPTYDFSQLYECRVCHWWAVRESWSLLEIYQDYDYLVVGEAEEKGTPLENIDRPAEPWNEVLKNERLYENALPLPRTLGELFMGGKRI